MDILYAWMASLSSSITPLVIKASSKTLVTSPWLFNLLWVGFGIPLVVILAFWKGGGLPDDWLSLVLLSLCAAGFYLFYTVSLYKLDVTTISPLFSLRTVFAVLLGILVLNEQVSTFAIVLITLIVLVSPLAGYNEKFRVKAFFQRYSMLAVLAMAFLALTGYFTNLSVSRNGYATTLLWQDLLTFTMLLPTALFIKSSAEKQVTSKKMLPFILLGLTGFGYTATSALAYAHNLALSSVIVSLPLSMIFAYLLSRRYSRFLEEHSPKVYAIRFTAAFIMVGCTIWLSVL